MTSRPIRYQKQFIQRHESEVVFNLKVLASAIFCVVFFAGAIGVLLKCGLTTALFTLELLCSLIP